MPFISARRLQALTGNGRGRRRTGIRTQVFTNRALAPQRRLRSELNFLRNSLAQSAPSTTTAPRLGNSRGRQRMLNVSRRIQRGRMSNVRQNPRDHCEFSFAKTDFWGPISTGLNVFKFRPGDSGIDFLDQFSIHFSQYRIAKNVSIKYTSAVSTTSNGQVSIGIDYHGRGQVSTLLDVQSLAGARTTNVYKEVLSSADALTAMKSHWHTIHQPGSKDETLQTAFTLYVYVYGYTTPNSTPTTTPEIGQIQVTYDVVFSGPRAVGSSRAEEPTALVVSKTAPVVGSTLVGVDPVVVQDQTEEQVDPVHPTTPAVLDAFSTNTDDEIKTSNLVLPAEDIQPGDEFSVIVTSKDAQALAYANTLNGVGSISGATVVTGYAPPKVNLFYSNGLPVPSGVIRPIDTPTIGGVKQNSLFFSQQQNYTQASVGTVVTATNADGTKPVFTDFLGDVFKVVDTVAEGVGLVADIAGAFLLVNGSSAADPVVAPLISLSSTFNAVEGSEEAPDVAAIFPGDTLNEVLPPLSSNNFWDNSLFGFHATINSSGAITVFSNFNGDWNINIQGSGATLEFIFSNGDNNLTLLTQGDRVSMIILLLPSGNLLVPRQQDIISLSAVAASATLGAVAGAGSTNALANIWQVNHSVRPSSGAPNFAWTFSEWTNTVTDIMFFASRVPSNLEEETFEPVESSLTNEFNALKVSRN